MPPFLPCGCLSFFTSLPLQSKNKACLCTQSLNRIPEHVLAMKIIPAFPQRWTVLRILLVLVLFVSAAVMLCFVLTPRKVMAADCTVCHKRSVTLTFPCDSADYRRHKDHGDPDGPCSASNP